MEIEGSQAEVKTMDGEVRQSRTSSTESAGRRRASSVEMHKRAAMERHASKIQGKEDIMEEYEKDMIKSTGHSFCSLQALGAFFSLEWLHFGDARTSDRKATFLFEHSNLSLISALLFTVAGAGFLITHEFEEEDMSTRTKILHKLFGFFWCFSTFSSLFGASISLIYLLGANEINTSLQFETFENYMHLWLRVPFALALLGFLFMYIGLVIYLILIFGKDMYICCIIICLYVHSDCIVYERIG